LAIALVILAIGKCSIDLMIAYRIYKKTNHDFDDRN